MSRSLPDGGNEISVIYWHTELAREVSEQDKARRLTEAGEARKKTKEAIERMGLDRLL